MSAPGSIPEPEIIALIPAYNEQDHIADVVRRALPYLPVLVVDDGSRDATAGCAEATGAAVLRQIPNQGKGAALRAGFRRTLEEGRAAALTLDADGQHDPAEIPRFLEAYAARRADLIIGVRDFSQMPFTRRIANTAGRRAFSWAVGQPIPDNQSGYRLISRRLMEALLGSAEQGFEFEVEMIAVCVERGYALEGVPISTLYAGERSHIHPLRHIAHFSRIVWQTRQRIRQARRARLPG